MEANPLENAIRESRCTAVLPEQLNMIGWIQIKINAYSLAVNFGTQLVQFERLVKMYLISYRILCYT